MIILLFTLTYLLAQDLCEKYPVVATKGEYKLLKVPTKQLPKVLKCMNKKKLNGLYWMHGNPMPDDYALVDEENICVFGDRTWSFHANKLGELLYDFTKATQLIYEFDFSDPNKWNIVPTFNLGGKKVKVPPSLLTFTAERDDKDPDVLLRRTWLGPKEMMTYRFTKVIDSKGRPLKHWDESVKRSPKYSYIAVKTKKKKD